MKTIAISDITISPKRQRREFNLSKLNELGESIRQHGLFHPVVLRQEGDRYVLVSGERRLRAMVDLHGLNLGFQYDGVLVRWNHIPYITLGELSPLAAEEAELEENVRRVDLSWQERAAATARLAKLRASQMAASGGPSVSVAAISEEVRGSSAGSSQEATRQEILLAPHLDDPEIAAAPSREVAFKLLKRREDAERRTELAATVGRTFTAAAHRCHNADALDWMKHASAEQFDVILTDPPYGVNAHEFGDSGGVGGVRGEHTYEDSPENFRALMEVFTVHSFRLAKPAAHLYCFCDIDWFLDLRLWFSEAGWRVFRTPMIFHKPNAPRAPWPDKGPQRQYDLILYAVKGERKVTALRSDVLIYRPDEQLGHPAQKPVELFTDLLQRSISPGDSIFDPFCGSGTIFPAAHALKCRATGVEIDPAAYGLAVRRIEALKEAA